MTRKQRRIVIHTVDYVVVAVLLIFFLFPLFVMVSRSLMTDREVLTLPIKVFPKTPDFSTYARALDADLLKYSANTLTIMVCSLIGTPLTSSLCAYGFAKIKFQGREVCFAIVLSTIMLPAIAVQIPMYVIYSKIHWLNTFWPFIIPPFLGGGAINIFLMRQFMKGIPDDICNAAKIDGANSFFIYARVVIPLCLPIILYIMVQTFFGVWNDFTGPLMYLTDDSKWTIAIGVYKKFVGAMSIQNLPNVQMATGVILLLPCAILFFIFQKQLIQGVTVTGIKG